MAFSRIRLDGEVTRLDEEEDEEEEKPHYPRLDRQKKHTIEVIVDRLKPSPQEKSRLFDSIQSALKVGGGVVVVSVDNKDTMYSQRNACPHCGISLGDLEPAEPFHLTRHLEHAGNAMDLASKLNSIQI